MYLVSAGRNLYVRTLCFCFCFPFLFQHGTPTFLVTKVLRICVRSFIRREKENPPEILCTKRFPRGPPELLDIQLSNSVYGQNTLYLCLSKDSPTGSRCTTRSIAKKSPTGSLPPAVTLAITRTFRPWTHTSDDSYIYQLSLVVATATVSFVVSGCMPRP